MISPFGTSPTPQYRELVPHYKASNKATFDICPKPLNGYHSEKNNSDELCDPAIAYSSIPDQKGTAPKALSTDVVSTINSSHDG